MLPFAICRPQGTDCARSVLWPSLCSLIELVILCGAGTAVIETNRTAVQTKQHRTCPFSESGPLLRHRVTVRVGLALSDPPGRAAPCALPWTPCVFSRPFLASPGVWWRSFPECRGAGMFVGPHHGGQGCPVPGRVDCGLTLRSEQVGSVGTGEGREWDGQNRADNRAAAVPPGRCFTATDRAWQAGALPVGAPARSWSPLGLWGRRCSARGSEGVCPGPGTRPGAGRGARPAGQRACSGLGPVAWGPQTWTLRGSLGAGAGRTRGQRGGPAEQDQSGSHSPVAPERPRAPFRPRVCTCACGSTLAEDLTLARIPVGARAEGLSC